ncbi:NAD-dependent protein deacylase [Campylobacter jejuni]|nr:NAD-dependent deacetylase [Campylobacter jejuni]SQE24501.1 NAD-dependent deacetylase [Campylobacter jejuni subsp. doylei]VTX75971.1 NAD-dependent protein deacylase [Campylobacter jejuni]
MKQAMLLSGAGLSTPSGFKIFKDNDGLLEEYDVMEVCSATGFRKNPKKVLDFYDTRRAQLQNVKPNHAHEKITDKQCLKCKSKDLRHNIVMFEEQAPAYTTLYSLLNQTSLFISIGTSGAVLPVGYYASMCEKSILNIYEKDANLEWYFDKIYIEDIISVIDKIALDIENFMKDGNV